MARNQPTGDNARKGAVKKRTQLKTTLGGATAWTKRSKKSGEFMAVKKPAKKKKAAKKATITDSSVAKAHSCQVYQESSIYEENYEGRLWRLQRLGTMKGVGDKFWIGDDIKV